VKVPLSQSRSIWTKLEGHVPEQIKYYQFMSKFRGVIISSLDVGPGVV